MEDDSSNGHWWRTAEDRQTEGGNKCQQLCVIVWESEASGASQAIGHVEAHSLFEGKALPLSHPIALAYVQPDLTGLVFKNDNHYQSNSAGFGITHISLLETQPDT